MGTAGRVIESRSVEETILAGREFAAGLKPGSAVGLIGELGSGKTHFVKGMALGLGVKSDIKSPSFTIINEYGGGGGLNHIDLYRLGDLNDNVRNAGIDGLGLDEYIYGKRVTVIEWADRAPELLSELSFVVKFTVTGEDCRLLVIEEIN